MFGFAIRVTVRVAVFISAMAVSAIEAVRATGTASGNPGSHVLPAVFAVILAVIAVRAGGWRPRT
jgi:hypothetical protein